MMKALLPALLILLALPRLSAQDEEIVFDVLTLEVALAYGQQDAYFQRMAAEPDVVDLRREPGLDLRLRRSTLDASRSIHVGAYSEQITLRNSLPGRRGHAIEFHRHDYGYYTETQQFHDLEKFWKTGVCFRNPRSDFYRPQVAGDVVYLYFTVLVPRPQKTRSEGYGIPELPEKIVIDDFVDIVRDHVAWNDNHQSGAMLRNLARFIPVDEAIATKSLADFLRGQVDPEMFEEALRSRQTGRRGRRHRRRFLMNESSEAIRGHQALVRSGRPAEFPEFNPKSLGRVDYAIYRHMLEHGLLPLEQRAAVLNRLLDAEASIDGHQDWIGRLSRDEIVVPPEEKASLLRRLEREFEARSVSNLLSIAGMNVLGLIALIVGLRFLCRRISFS